MATKKTAAILKPTIAKPAPKPAPKPIPKKPTNNVVAVRNNASVSADAIGWKERMTAVAARGREQVAKAPVGGGNAMSFRAGTITYQDKDIGHSVDIIIAAMQFERTYYSTDFNPNSIVSPDCYSFDNIAPHETAVDKQSTQCSTCKFNAFESARQGRGKGCKEGIKIAAFPAASSLSKGEDIRAEEIATASIATAKFSVLNTREVVPVIEQAFDEYVHPSAVVMELTCNPDPKRQIRNTLEITREVDGSVIIAIEKRIDEAEKMLTTPYAPPEAKAPAAAAKKRTRSF